ncbi:MAG: substrate-binding domain-containing protein [Chthoniobacterales bacterium]|nr:substrate-binding domain-containing protein [Chthoniobacterales bacterium]
MEISLPSRLLLSLVILAASLVTPIFVKAAAKNEGKLHSVGVTLAEDGGPYYEQVVRGVEHAAREINPEVQFSAVSCKNGAALQIEQLDKFVRDGVDVIVIQRSYAGDSSPAVQRARQAGVVVVAIDAAVPGGTDALVRPDERQGGLVAAQYVAARLKDGGEVALANGPTKYPAIKDRADGFTDELKKHPSIRIVEGQDTGMSRDGATKAMEGFMTRHPHLAAVYGVNDPVAVYCEAAALRAGRSDLFIVGMEGSPRSVTAMKDPARLIAASPGEDPYALAETALRRGGGILRGEPRPSEPILVPFTPLSRANVEGYQGWSK